MRLPYFTLLFCAVAVYSVQATYEDAPTQSESELPIDALGGLRDSIEFIAKNKYAVMAAINKLPPHPVNNTELSQEMFLSALKKLQREENNLIQTARNDTIVDGRRQLRKSVEAIVKNKDAILAIIDGLPELEASNPENAEYIDKLFPILERVGLRKRDTEGVQLDDEVKSLNQTEKTRFFGALLKLLG